MAWWLAYEELYGDMDKEYPIMTKGEEHSDSYYDYNRNDVNLDNPFTDPKDRERAEKVVGKFPKQVWPTPLKDDCYPTLGSTKEVDEVYAHHFPGNTKPEPDLKGAAVQKYKEDTGIKDLKDYVASTYQGHYTNQGSKLVSTKAVNSNDILLNYAFANNKTRIYQAKITVNFIKLPRLTIKHIPRKETYV